MPLKFLPEGNLIISKINSWFLLKNWGFIAKYCISVIILFLTAIDKTCPFCYGEYRKVNERQSDHVSNLNGCDSIVNQPSSTYCWWLQYARKNNLYLNASRERCRGLQIWQNVPDVCIHIILKDEHCIPNGFSVACPQKMSIFPPILAENYKLFNKVNFLLFSR